MTITVDGERSRRRLPLARRALASIASMGIPAKSGMVDGFTFKVLSLDDIQAGRITAPFGVHVTLSDAQGFKPFTLDSAECAAMPIYSPLDNDSYLAVLNPLSTSRTDPTHVFGGGSAGGITIKWAPQVLIEAQQWKPAQPVCIALGGEDVVTNYTYQRSSGNLLAGAQAAHCYSNGNSDTASPCISESWSFMPYSADAEAVNNHYGLIPMLTTAGYFEYVKWKQGGLFIGSNGYPKLGQYDHFYAPTGAAGSTEFCVDTIYQGKSAVWAIGAAPRQIAAHFSRITGDIKGVSVLWPTVIVAGDEAWSLTLTLLSLASGNQTVNYATLGPALQALADAELAWVVASSYPSAGWSVADAKLVIGAMFGWPAQSAYTIGPRDNATFADASGTVYSWMRCTDPNATQDAYAAGYNGVRHGGFKFSYPDGFVRVPLAMPAAVLNDTTLRPRITLMTATTYCCIADNSAGEIRGLYLGSPFGAWQDVGLPAGVTMYAIRVVEPGDTLATAGFIGIGKETTPNGPVYRVYIKPAGFGWYALSPIPVSGVNDLAASWDVCVFGDDPLVHAMQSARQHPAAMPNIPPALR